MVRMIMMTNDDDYDNVMVIIMILFFYLQNIKTRGRSTKVAQSNFSTIGHISNFIVEACVTGQLKPWTPDLEVRGSSLTHCVVSLDKELYFTLTLFTQVYKWVSATYMYCGGG